MAEGFNNEHHNNSRSDNRNENRGENRNYRNKRARKKFCNFCLERIEKFDYKEPMRFNRFMSERAKILPRRVTGLCARHQRALTLAIKHVRFLGILPYVNR